MSQSSAEYCMESVRFVFFNLYSSNYLLLVYNFRKYDYENFISSILLKNSLRACALAIRSFNVEIARVAEHVSQEHIAQMRLKFWEDTVTKCLGTDLKVVPKHPVAFELFKVRQILYQ